MGQKVKGLSKVDTHPISVLGSKMPWLTVLASES